jgi:hypothetical protein
MCTTHADQLLSPEALDCLGQSLIRLQPLAAISGME